MTLRLQAARGLKWQAIEIGGRQLLSLAVFTTLARLLDPAAFGLIGLVGVYLAFVGMFVDQGIGMALIQRRELEPGHLDAAFWFNILCATVLCVATIALADPVSVLLRDVRVAPLLRWASLSLVINAAAAVQAALFMRAMDFRTPAIRTVLASGVGGLVGVIMALRGLGVWALIGQQLAAALAGCLFLWSASAWRPKGRPSYHRLGELLGVSSSVFATDFLWVFSSQIDQIVIGRYSGAGVLGQYVVGRKLSELARLSLHRPLSIISMPALSRLQDNHIRMCNAIYKGMELNAVVSFGGFVGLAAVAPTLVPLVFGEQWRPAVSLLQLTCMYSLVLGLFVYCYPALLAGGRPGRYLIVNVACAVGAAVACIIGIRFGVQTLLCGLILNISGTGGLALLFLHARLGLSPWRYCRPCLMPGLAAGLMFVGVCVTRSALPERTGQWPSLIIQVLAGSSAYASLMLMLAPKSVVGLGEVAKHAIIAKAHPV